jgi:predicted HTH transcriptional regulator
VTESSPIHRCLAKRTASKDLEELLEKDIIQKTGITGRGTVYTLKGAIKGTRSGQWDNAKN